MTDEDDIEQNEAQDAIPSEEEEEVVEEEVQVDPLQEALDRAEKAEKEIAYRDAEIQNIRKRSMQEKSEVMKFGSMPLARRMVSVLTDVDRALQSLDDDDQSAVAQGLRLLRNKLWHELSAEGVAEIDAKSKPFDPSTMDAVMTIPATEQHPAGTVVDLLEAGFLYKEKVMVAARVVVASED
ncbi:MAG: nucleotide exchange factor GrpE [Candidatus Poseidoniales archaeon]